MTSTDRNIYLSVSTCPRPCGTSLLCLLSPVLETSRLESTREDFRVVFKLIHNVYPSLTEYFREDSVC